MSAGDPVSVQILDKEYLIACPPEEQEDLQRAATLLNQRLRQIREHGRNAIWVASDLLSGAGGTSARYGKT